MAGIKGQRRPVMILPLGHLVGGWQVFDSTVCPQGCDFKSPPLPTQRVVRLAIDMGITHLYVVPNNN